MASVMRAGNSHIPSSPKSAAPRRTRSKSVGSAPPDSPTSSRGKPSAAAFETKKGKAGGGKGSWGRIEDEIWAAQNVLPPSPTVINEEDEGLVDAGVVLVEKKWDITGEEMRKYLEPKLREYFVSGDTTDVVADIRELSRSDLNPMVVELVLTEAIERTDVECELASVLLAHLSVEGTFTRADMEGGFDRALVQLDDLVLDNPHAHEAMGKFMARAVADEIICPKYVTSRPAPGDSDEAVRAFAKGRGLVASPQGLQRLEHVWGTNGGLSPVDELRDKVHQLLEEYLETRNLEEAVACVRELHAPHFHHEVVFQVIGLAIDGRDERDMLALSALLKAACGEALISLVQLEKGLSRIFESISDIELDCPKATLNLDSFCHLSSAFLPRAACHRAAKLAKITMNKVKGRRVRSVTMPTE